MREMTLQEIADVFGVTRSRIAQIEARALRQIRRPGVLRDALIDFVDHGEREDPWSWIGGRVHPRPTLDSYDRQRVGRW